MNNNFSLDIIEKDLIDALDAINHRNEEFDNVYDELRILQYHISEHLNNEDKIYRQKIKQNKTPIYKKIGIKTILTLSVVIAYILVKMFN